MTRQSPPTSRRRLGPIIGGVLILAIATPALAFKMAVVPLRPGSGAGEELASSLTDVVVAELRRASGIEILTNEEISAILGHESDKQLLGCDEISCLAEIGGALGADELLSGSVAKLGTSWILHLKRIDVNEVKVVSQVDRRFKGGSIDDLLDALPAMTKKLVAGAPLATGAAPARGAAAAPAPAAAGPIGSTTKPPPVQEVPLKNAKDREALVLASDGKGRYLAYNAEKMNRSPLFFGDGNKLYKQRNRSSGKSSRTAYTIAVWDPRYVEGYKRQFVNKDGDLHLRCGDTKTPLTPVPAAEAKKILAKAKLFEQQWIRGVTFLAMDSAPRYFVLDQALEPRGNRDYRMFVGEKGSLRFVEVLDVAIDNKGEKYVTGAGVLALEYKGRDRVGTWTPKGGQPLELQVLSHFTRAADVYTKLGTYEQTKFGTICDPPL